MKRVTWVMGWRLALIGILALTLALMADALPGKPALATFPGTNGKIAFAKSSPGIPWDIYTMNADGSQQTRLTRDNGNNTQPNWSADGSKIAFVSDRSGIPEIYVMNADGSGQTKLTTNPNTCGIPGDFSPSWSPDGTRIAFSRCQDGSTQIWVMNADGSGNRRAFPETDCCRDQPDWSPDGRKLAYQRFNGADFYLVVRNVEGSDPGQVMNFDDGYMHDPSWSPDGAKIAYWTGLAGVGDRAIWVVNADGSGKRQLTDPALGAAERPSWSPDGAKITFWSFREGFDDIFVMNADGSGQTRIALDGSVGDPAWGSFTPSTSGLRIEQQLGSCLSSVSSAWGFNNAQQAWLYYIPGAPESLQTLTELVSGNGYIIMVSNGCTLTVGTKTLTLYSTFNLISWP